MERITFKGDESLAELADRVYGTQHADANTRARVQATLLQGNPHMAEFDRLPIGTPIVIPKVEGVEWAGPQHPLEKSLDAVLAQVATALGSAREQLDEAARRKAEQAAEDSAYVESKKFRERAEREMTKEEVERIIAGSKVRAAQARVLQKFQRKGLSEMEGDLQELRGVFSELATRTLGKYAAPSIAKAEDKGAEERKTAMPTPRPRAKRKTPKKRKRGTG